MTVRGVMVAIAVLTVQLGLGGCGNASSPSPPSGVDELTIPTPSPDPADFVTGVDNPWFPLEPGSTRRYDVSDVHGNHTLTVTVEAGPEVAGVPTTARVSTEGQRVVTDWFAQDTDGNVWWLGRAGVWRAGEDGAEAGVAMLATPRVGDGYRLAYRPGVVEDIARIVSIDDGTTVPAGTYDVVVTEQRSTLESGGTLDRSYARGVGLVAEEAVTGGFRAVQLAGIDRVDRVD